jgi:hypothetical protein
MENLSNVVSFAKLRGSWGSIGDQSVSNALYVPTMGSVVQNSWLDGSGTQFYQIGTPGAVSTEITWQDIEQWNLGVDLNFFNKFGVVFEWYERTTRNMLIPGESLGNFGTLQTRGWELSLDFSHTFENGLHLTANTNLADAISITTKGADWKDPWENRSIGTTFSTGRRYGDIYGYVTDRLFQKEDFVYDADGNFVPVTIIHAGKGTNGDPGDRVVIGNSMPRYEYGFRIGADWKGFDLGLFFQGIGKREIWGDGQLAIPGYHVKDGAMPQAIAGDFWKEDRTDAFYPRAWNLGIAAGAAAEGYAATDSLPFGYVLFQSQEYYLWL